MANVCCTDYVFFAENRESLAQFREILEEVLKGVQNRRIPSESGECDYEVLQRELGIPEGRRTTGRGFVVDLSELQEDSHGPYFKVEVQDCWRASPDVISALLQDDPEINFVYREDEPQEHIASTNDSDGRFFPHRFRIWGTQGEHQENLIDAWLEDEEAALQFLKTHMNVKGDNLKKAMELMSKNSNMYLYAVEEN